MADQENAATSQPTQPVTQQPSRQRATATDQEKLERIALQIYQSDASTGFNEESKAHNAFIKANSFLATAQKIRAGILSAEAEIEPKRVEIEVPVYRQMSDEKMEVVRDPLTNKIVTEKVMSDPYSFAPNLPDSHPINLRFRPVDGIPASQRNGKPNVNVADDMSDFAFPVLNGTN